MHRLWSIEMFWQARMEVDHFLLESEDMDLHGCFKMVWHWWMLMVDGWCEGMVYIVFYLFMIFYNIPWLVWCQLVYVWSLRQLGQQIWINKNISNSTTHWQFHHRSTFVLNDHGHVTRLAFSVQDVSDLLNVLEAGGFESDPDFAKSPNKKDIDIRWSFETDDWR